MTSTIGSYLVVGFIPDNDDDERDGVHTPLRSDGYYGKDHSPVNLANHWRKNPIHPQERVVVVQIVDDGSMEVDNGL